MKKQLVFLLLFCGAFLLGAQTNLSRYLNHPPSGEVRMTYRDDGTLIGKPVSLDLTNVFIECKSEQQVYILAHHVDKARWVIEFVQ